MKEADRISEGRSLTPDEIRDTVLAAVADEAPRRVLLIPPDYTRLHSGAGRIAHLCYHHFTEHGAQVDVLPAVGTHRAMPPAQWQDMFGDIPYARCLRHDWRHDLAMLGTVPAEFVAGQTEGLWDRPVAAQINRRVIDGGYDLILSIGQVVPHEVVGMANHAKNLFVGVGGSEMINETHMISAVYGIERILGRGRTPVRAIFDWAFERYLTQCPIAFILTVTTCDRAASPGEQLLTHGVFCGRGRRCFEAAVRLSREKNVIHVDRPIRTCVAWLDPSEFHTTWLGNKAVYRTRMAIADGGELIVLAPGVRGFGEDPAIDRLIRTYGYRGREEILAQFAKPDHADLRANMSAAAHLIHGSSEGRFRITYAVRELPEEEVAAVGYDAARYDDLARRYGPSSLLDGWNTLPDGEEIYFISNPALGLWTRE